MQAQITGPLSPPPQSTAPSREALLEQLTSALARLDSLSQTPPKVQVETALWFHRDEFDQVNQTWRESGIDAVLSRWGESRTLASGSPTSETWDPLAASQQAPEGAVVLLVSEFGHEPDTSRAQQQYFRSSRFKLSQEFQTEIRETLERSGLLAKLLPQVDAETNTPLADAPITEISCTIEWHGRDNFYGDGSTLTISLTLSPAERDPELLLLTVNKRGDIARRLWCEQFMETGYEGHAHMLMHLSETELQTILPTVARVAELTPARQQPFRMGAWLGNSLPQGQ